MTPPGAKADEAATGRQLETRSMIGLFYVYKDEKCAPCKGTGIAGDVEYAGRLVPLTCMQCEGKGVRTFKVELSEAIKELRRVDAL